MAITKWVLDPMHSEITFKVRHLMISNVSGSFATFTVEAETEEEDLSTLSVKFSTDVASLSTQNEQRDGHLKGADFFDAAQFPTISFESTSIEAAGEGEYHLHGHLTLKGETKPVTLKVEAGGVANDSYGSRRAGFTIEGKINRQDFGLTWSAPTESGGLLVGDDVKISAEIQVIKQA